MAGAAGFLASVAGVFGFMLSRTDRAEEKRRASMRMVVVEVLDEREIPERLKTIEAILPRVERKIDETAEIVRDTNATLNRLIGGAHLHNRQDD